MKVKDALLLLGLTRGYSESDLKNSYRRLIRMHHPDVAGESSHEMAKKINMAFEILSKFLREHPESIVAPATISDSDMEGEVEEVLQNLHDFVPPSRKGFVGLRRSWFRIKSEEHQDYDWYNAVQDIINILNNMDSEDFFSLRLLVQKLVKRNYSEEEIVNAITYMHDDKYLNFCDERGKG